MDKASIIQKMENTLNALRAELARNNGSTLATISANVKAGLQAAKAGVLANDNAGNLLDKFREKIDDLERSLKSGDKTLSAKALDAMEKVLRV